MEDLTVLVRSVSFNSSNEEADWLLCWVEGTEQCYMATTAIKIYFRTLFLTQVFYRKDTDHLLPAEIFHICLQISFKVALKVNDASIDSVDEHDDWKIKLTSGRNLKVLYSGF